MRREEIAANFPQSGVKVKTGQTLTLNMEKGTVTVRETGETYPCEQFGEQTVKILEAGGIKPMIRKRFGKGEA